MLTPTRSVGSRSGVNWTRFHEQSIDPASALARLVLPTPGTSSIKRCPSASNAMTANSIESRLPRTTVAMLPTTLSKSVAKLVADAAVSVTVPKGNPSKRLRVPRKVSARRPLAVSRATRYGRGVTTKLRDRPR